MSFNFLCVALLIAGGASSGPDVSQLMQMDAEVRKSKGISDNVNSMLEQMRNLGAKRVDGKLPESELPHVTVIKTLVEENLKPVLESEKQNAQQEITEHLAAFETCNGQGSTTLQTIGGLEVQVGNVRQQHATCRGEEATSLANKTTAHNALVTTTTNFVNSAVPSHPDGTGVAAAAEFIGYLVDMEQRFCLSRTKDILVGLKRTFDNATTSHDRKVTACNQAQAQFEQDFCVWRAELSDACSTLSVCHQRALEQYSSRTSQIQGLVEQWKIEWTGLEKILCFVGIWLNDNSVTNQTLDSCNQMDVDTSMFDMTFPDAPPQGSCDTEKVAQYPCGAEFTSSEYGDFAGVAQCTPCPDLPNQGNTPATTTTTATGISLTCTDDGTVLSSPTTLVNCPGDAAGYSACDGPTFSSSSVWGSGPYKGDSSVCRAAMHAGFIDHTGGDVIVVMDANGEQSYTGSGANGVGTTDYMAPWAPSMTFQQAGR